jgi:hypothetical protein
MRVILPTNQLSGQAGAVQWALRQHRGYEWELDTFSATYNNEISSFQGYSNCDAKLFENISFNASPGATYGPYASSNDVGAMNDKASSARFY